MFLFDICPWGRPTSGHGARTATSGARLVAASCLLTLLVAAPASSQTAAPASADPGAPPVPDFHAAEPALRWFVLRALDANPGLREAQARHRSALEKPPQVTALPDPSVTFTQMLRSVETRVGPQLNTVMVSQAIPWFGKRDLRGQIAASDASAALELWQAKRRDVVLHVKTAFYNLGYVDAAIAVTEEERSILEHYEQLAQDRYASGAGLQQAVIRVQSELTKVLNRMFVLTRQRTSLVARLNTLTDRAPHEPVGVARLEDPPLESADALDLAALVATGETDRHEIRAADALVERNERAIALAQTGFRPDLTIGAGMVNVGRRGAMTGTPDAGKNAWTLSLGISVPIWRDKLRAAVRQAVEDVTVQREVRARIVNDMEFDVSDQMSRLETLSAQIRLLEDVLIPQAREAQLSTEAAYQTGQVGVLDLLDSERSLLDVRLANERQRADFLIALAELERAIGARFPR